MGWGSLIVDCHCCLGCLGEGGKNVFDNRLAMLLLSSVVVICPSSFVVLSGGILGNPLSPTGSFKYLLAGHISEVFISSR